MKLMVFHLILVGLSTVSATAITNRLLENYERKLNSLNGFIERRRSNGKHRMKRYRCIEEYVDEHGNVIEEGKEHFTTVAPITDPTLGRSHFSGSQLRNSKDTTKLSDPPKSQAKGVTAFVIKQPKRIRVGVIKPARGTKVRVIRRKPKTKKKKLHNRRPIPDEDRTGMQRVYPTEEPRLRSTTTAPLTTTSTYASPPTTEIIEWTGEENSDDTIMKKFFPHMHLTFDRPSKGAARNRKQHSTTPTPSLEITRSPPLDFTEGPAPLAEENHIGEQNVRAVPPSVIRRHQASTYVKPREDYENEYEDYTDFGDYLPYYRMNLRRRPRPYPRMMIRRFPSRPVFARTRVPHIPVSDDIDGTVMMPVDSVTQEPREMERLRPLPMATQTWLSPSPAPLPPPPTTSQSSSSTTVLPQNHLRLEESTPHTCAKMRRLAATFGIHDISVYARKNCRLLLTFAPGHTCEQIVHFVDSCHKNHLLN